MYKSVVCACTYTIVIQVKRHTDPVSMTPPVTLAVTGSHRENERHHATQGASSLLGLPEPAATPMTKSGRRHSAMGSRPLRRWPDVPPPGRVRQTNLPASHDGGCQVSATTEADRPTATGYGGGGVRVIHASIHAKGKKVENQLNARAMIWRASVQSTLWQHCHQEDKAQGDIAKSHKYVASSNSLARGPARPGLPFSSRWAWNSLSLSGWIMAILGNVASLVTSVTEGACVPPLTHIWAGAVSCHMPGIPTIITRVVSGALAPTPALRRDGPVARNTETMDLDNPTPRSLRDGAAQVQRTRITHATVEQASVVADAAPRRITRGPTQPPVASARLSAGMLENLGHVHLPIGNQQRMLDPALH